ncbi:Uma2 family endonuclease [Oculatella sp. FACHB-28]|uniref:Uma2 family endonuclease n=1 Tax=Cyanophyceae TaxID=3028117 RepID=UPI00168945E3|nr:MULTISPECIES: Uma2 family endonuclease [Cyanophyceae]MBD2059534.1 Uma2 family endonuclease [Oculatella sp. FACHB-28]MBD2068805.1 Uma2 family endonuclease [Leptolyngbya sp. FACHB-671]
MQTQQRYYTPEEYLAQEDVAEFRNEYRDGEIVPMTGGSINHNQIAGNIYAFLKFALRKTDYKPYIGDLRLWIPQYRQYTYPDVFLIQGQPVFQDQRTDTILNPYLIVEVLSKSTKDYDHTDKFRYYRSIPGLQEYVLINQYAVGVEQYTKAEGNSWLFQAYESEAEKITFASIGIEMLVEDIYENVNFNLGNKD